MTVLSPLGARSRIGNSLTLHKKWSFTLRISSVNVPKSAVIADLVTFTEKVLNGKLHFLCSVRGFQWPSSIEKTLWLSSALCESVPLIQSSPSGKWRYWIISLRKPKSRCKKHLLSTFSKDSIYLCFKFTLSDITRNWDSRI